MKCRLAKLLQVPWGRYMGLLRANPNAGLFKL
jgi:hypothetical protein